MTIVEFITARLEEEESWANAATPGPWSEDDERRRAGVRRAVDAEMENLAGFDGEFGDGCSAEEMRAGQCKDSARYIERSGVLRALASFWSTHPDYRKEWDTDGE